MVGLEDSFVSLAGDFAFRCCTGDFPGASLSLHACTAVQLLEGSSGVFCKGQSKERVVMIGLSSVWWFVDL